jgi:hypothetical protein
MKNNVKCAKTRKYMHKPSRKPSRKSMRKNLGAAPPDYFKDYSKKEQLERVLDLVKASDLKASDLNEILFDAKKRPLKFNTKIWSKLTYFNAYAVTGEYGTHDDDMKTIVYMLKHDVYEHKKSNKDKWKKSINDAIFKGKYLDKFKDKNYNGPVIKEIDKIITWKDLTIILLENRLKILDWFHAKSVPRPSVRNSRAAEIPVPNNRGPTPNKWNAEPVVVPDAEE